MSRPLKQLLLRYEMAFLLLLLVTGALGGLWVYYWQQTSSESVRLEQLRHTAQQIQTDLFRQIKEVTWARLRDDPEALELYSSFSRKIDGNFNRLRKGSVVDEKNAIGQIAESYRFIEKDMNKIFTDPYMISQVVRLRMLDPAYERNMVSRFEASYIDLENILLDKQKELDKKREYWTGLAPILIATPLLLAGILFLFSRSSIQREVVRPIEALKQGAAVISKGEFNHTIPQNGVTEMVDLAGTINDMALELASNRDALVDAEKQAALGALVPVVAHNIRNPLASIRAHAQLLEHVDEVEDKLEIKDAILETVDRLGRWVSALVSYLHPLKPLKKITQLTTLFDTVADLLQPRLDEKEITIEHERWEENHSVQVDPDLMEQALYGLLSNAVDASPQGGKLILSVYQDQHDLKMIIADQGVGMPFEAKPTDLTPGQSTKQFGTGLGIPVAFKVCNTHGWKMSYENNNPKGTRVLITIPAAI
ncbi:MAG: ATP-binding protein [Gammaproteobacteria bacterium]